VSDVRAVAILFALAALGGCRRGGGYPESVIVRPFSAPRGEAAYVIIYEPWMKSDWKVEPRSDVDVLESLDGATLSCANTPCEYRREVNAVVLTNPAGIDHVEVLVSKEGYEPARVIVPYQRGETEPTRIIFMKRKQAP
jgi:hypothetical protein